MESITGEMVDQIGQRFQRMTGPVTQKRRPRKIFGKDVTQEKVQGTEPEAKEVVGDHEKQIPEPVVEKLDTMGSPRLVEGLTSIENESMEEQGKPRFVLKKVELNTLPPRPLETTVAEYKKSVEIEIGDMKATVNVPFQIIQQAQSSTREHRVKLAGALAARALQQNPQFTSSHFSDPVDIWGKIRESFMNVFEEEKKLGVM